jgi:hypothetical protein
MAVTLNPDMWKAPEYRLPHVSEKIPDEYEFGIDATLCRSPPRPSCTIEHKMSGATEWNDPAVWGGAPTKFRETGRELHSTEVWIANCQREDGSIRLDGWRPQHPKAARGAILVQLVELKCDYNVVQRLSAGGNEVSYRNVGRLHQYAGFFLQAQWRIKPGNKSAQIIGRRAVLFIGFDGRDGDELFGEWWAGIEANASTVANRLAHAPW